MLDNPVWASVVHGPHAHLARRHGAAAGFLPEVSPFHGLAAPDDPAAWSDLAALAGPGTQLLVTGPRIAPPDDWTVVEMMDGVQLVDTALRVEPDPEAVLLGPDDVPEMLDLTARTRPGPFGPRTLELGVYLGIRHDGRLIAMAGERMRPPGFTEISAVCTDPDFRGKGLATRLVRAVAEVIRGRGETPFMHASATNTGAIRLYEAIGFTVRARPRFAILRSPA
ncbi:GNAT family N-acetyltransferase [Catenuloplanes atrovinosus]|uniref:Ribosomal protein S18 acetylase RimI-like enzyme n=1 Tax=Catenuloplanes atrovinosus TaxID=137266 RepID=A0AAE3YM76_9ACTN|nr:GNAT family N-acetyltransferase [Catenuloplanes atrovinosus]MDR7276095.1 ribosomal protein S18 acetylase RimI-like enzyme [Catenuloplanes atrovinosus]